LKVTRTAAGNVTEAKLEDTTGTLEVADMVRYD
jgi:hypothetical protein